MPVEYHISENIWAAQFGLDGKEKDTKLSEKGRVDGSGKSWGRGGDYGQTYCVKFSKTS